MNVLPFFWVPDKMLYTKRKVSPSATALNTGSFSSSKKPIMDIHSQRVNPLPQRALSTHGPKIRRRPQGPPNKHSSNINQATTSVDSNSSLPPDSEPSNISSTTSSTHLITHTSLNSASSRSIIVSSITSPLIRSTISPPNTSDIVPSIGWFIPNVDKKENT